MVKEGILLRIGKPTGIHEEIKKRVKGQELVVVDTLPPRGEGGRERVALAKVERRIRALLEEMEPKGMEVVSDERWVVQMAAYAFAFHDELDIELEEILHPLESWAVENVMEEQSVEASWMLNKEIWREKIEETKKLHKTVEELWKEFRELANKDRERALKVNFFFKSLLEFNQTEVAALLVKGGTTNLSLQIKHMEALAVLMENLRDLLISHSKEEGYYPLLLSLGFGEVWEGVADKARKYFHQGKLVVTFAPFFVFHEAYRKIRAKKWSDWPPPKANKGAES